LTDYILHIILICISGLFGGFSTDTAYKMTRGVSYAYIGSERLGFLELNKQFSFEIEIIVDTQAKDTNGILVFYQSKVHKYASQEPCFFAAYVYSGKVFLK